MRLKAFMFTAPSEYTDYELVTVHDRHDWCQDELLRQFCISPFSRSSTHIKQVVCKYLHNHSNTLPPECYFSFIIAKFVSNQIIHLKELMDKMNGNRHMCKEDVNPYHQSKANYQFKNMIKFSTVSFIAFSGATPTN